ncbi:hypothetical protein HD806DRAFT_290566 [Xylariaceae sp. AK1471]|nr:hypothetical protein HD806DRAFT_290566 [Xylariaceae sp. AK1471]
MEDGQESSSPSETGSTFVSHSPYQPDGCDIVSETGSLLSEQHPETTQTRRQTLGWAVIVTFVLGPVSALSALAALLYLWTSTTQHLWASLATTTWLARVVTVSSLVIRTEVDLLTGFSGSMLTALILETGYVRLTGVATLSIMRVASPSLWNLIQGLRQISKKQENMKWIIISIILFGLSIALQFSSTLLFSDIRLGELPGEAANMFYNYDLDWGWNKTDSMTFGNSMSVCSSKLDINQGLLRSSWHLRPQRFPIFGEHRHPIPSKNGVDDTGYIYRSFLPVADTEQRVNFKSFQGPAFVLDTRVSCQRPIFTNIQLAVDYVYYGNPNYNGTISGAVSNSTDVEGLWFPTDPLSSQPSYPPGDAINKRTMIIPFSCEHMTSLYGTYKNDYPWSYEICQLQSPNVYSWFDINPGNHWNRIGLQTEAAGSLRSKLFNFTTNDSLPAYSPAYLIIADNVTMRNPEHNVFTTVTVPVVPPKNRTDSGWPTSLELRFSLCYTAWGSSNSYIELQRLPKTREESIIPYAVTDERESFNFKSVLSQYGIGDTSASIGVVTMDEPIVNGSIGYPFHQPSIATMLGRMMRGSRLITTLEDTTSYVRTKTDGITHWLGHVTPAAFEPGHTAMFHNFSRIISRLGSSDIITIPDPLIASFFRQAMNISNNSPASSLSALITLLSSMSYYDQLPIFKKAGTAKVVTLTPVSHPQSWSGLITVITLLVAHLGICMLVLYLFRTRAKVTKLGDAWSSVGQLIGLDSNDLMPRAAFASDEAMETFLKEQGRGQRLVRLAAMDGQVRRGRIVYAEDVEKTYALKKRKPLTPVDRASVE